MKTLCWESWAVILASIISLGYILSHGPYWMGAFTFIAQPLFFVAALNYILKVSRDLKKIM